MSLVVERARDVGYHPELIYQLCRRDLLVRYRGSVLGFLWVLVLPFLMLVVYTFVFTQVFGLRWPGADAEPVHFAVMLYLGLVLHGMLSECLQRGPMLVLGESHLVRKVVFPLDALAWSAVAQAVFHGLCGILVVLVVIALLGYELQWTMVFLPLVLLPFVLLLMGITWLLGALGVFFRDLSQIMGLISTLLLFLSPVFYPVSSLPAVIRPYVYLNPLTFAIEQVRSVIIHGAVPDWIGLLAYIGLAAMVFFAAHWAFVKAQKGFADVI